MTVKRSQRDSIRDNAGAMSGGAGRARDQLLVTDPRDAIKNGVRIPRQVKDAKNEALAGVLRTLIHTGRQDR